MWQLPLLEKKHILPRAVAQAEITKSELAVSEIVVMRVFATCSNKPSCFPSVIAKMLRQSVAFVFSASAPPTMDLQRFVVSVSHLENNKQRFYDTRGTYSPKSQQDNAILDYFQCETRQFRD